MPGLGRRLGSRGGGDDDEGNAKKDSHVSDVEDACVKRTKAEDAEVGHDPVLTDPIDEVAEAASREEGQAEPSAALEGRPRANEGDEGSDEKAKRGDREDEQTQTRRKGVAQAEEAAGVLGQGEVNETAKKGTCGAVGKRLTRHVLRGLIAAYRGEHEGREQKQMASSGAEHTRESIGAHVTAAAGAAA